MKPKKKEIRFPIWYILLALFAGIMIINNFSAPEKVEKISYSQFKDYLAEGRVKQVTIEKEKIKGKALISRRKG